MHTDRPLVKKLEILGRIEAGEKASKLAIEYGISQTTISGWKKQKLKEASDKGMSLNMKRNTEAKYPVIADCVVTWLKDMRTGHRKTVPISYQMLKEKAEG